MKKSSCLKVFIFIFASCLLHITVPPVHSQKHSSGELGKLKGIVVDWQYARIPYATLLFEDDLVRKEVSVNEEGAYEVELPVGNYKVTAHVQHFQRYSLTSFFVAPDGTRTLNVMLQVEPQKPIKCPKGFPCL